MLNHRPYALPILFCVLHTLGMLWFAGTNVPLAGPNADAGSMVWLVWVWIDFPLMLLTLPASGMIRSNVVAISIMLLIGGVQWALWGWLLHKAIAFISTGGRIQQK